MKHLGQENSVVDKWIAILEFLFPLPASSFSPLCPPPCHYLRSAFFVPFSVHVTPPPQSTCYSQRHKVHTDWLFNSKFQLFNSTLNFLCSHPLTAAAGQCAAADGDILCHSSAWRSQRYLLPSAALSTVRETNRGTFFSFCPYGSTRTLGFKARCQQLQTPNALRLNFTVANTANSLHLLCICNRFINIL